MEALWQTLTGIAFTAASAAIVWLLKDRGWKATTDARIDQLEKNDESIDKSIPQMRKDISEIKQDVRAIETHMEHVREAIDRLENQK